MRRRSFITTLPLAAATPALAGDTSGSSGFALSPDDEGPNPWIDLEAGPATALAGVRSRHVRVTGSARIASLGPAPSGLTRVVRFTEELILVHSPPTLLLPNNGQNLLIAPDDVIVAVSTGGPNWMVTAYQPASVFSKIDRRHSQGGGRYKLAIGADAGTVFPDFAVEGAYSRVKVAAKSLILGDPSDTTEIGVIAASGTPDSPQAWVGNALHHITYSYAPYLPLDAKGAPSVATFNGRFAQEYFFQVETPSATARGGGIAWGATMPGQIVPYDRMWLRNYGLVLPGRAVAEDSGLPYNHDYGSGPGGASANFHHIFAPGPVNWGDVAGWGNLSLIATDEAAGCSVIAIRRNGALGTGHDWMYNLAADELRLHTVSGGVRTPRWGFPVDGGHLLPAVARATDIGSPSRPVRTVHADTLDVRRATRGPAAVLENVRPDFSGDLVTLRAGRAGGEAFNFLRAVADGGDGEDAAIQISGSGHVSTAGAWSGTGGSAGAYLEWADGNPYTEDRVGWTVVMEDGRIRRARRSDPRSAVIGVVTARPNLAGNAAWSHWSGKYLTDDFGRVVTRPVDCVRWIQPIIESQQIERTRVVKERVRRPVRERVELVESLPHLENEQGRWTQRWVETRRAAERPVTEAVLIHAEDGSPVLSDRGEHASVEVPLFEEVELERPETCAETVDVQTGEVEHCYPRHAVPAGVVVPIHAEQIVVRRKVLNPDFDPSQPYVARQARPAWGVVALLGPERVRRGERTGARWILMRAVSDAVDEWLVR